MKIKFFLILALGMTSTLFMLLPNTVAAEVHPPIVEEVNETDGCILSLFAPLRLSDLPDMKRKEVEKAVGRKLKFKERMTLRTLRRHANAIKGLDLTAEDCALMEKKSKGGVLFGILGFFILGLVFGIVAIVLGVKARKLAKANPDCDESESALKRGTTAIVLGILALVVNSIIVSLLL